MDIMKVSIIGAGGVGGYIGAKLALAGQDVTFVARGENYHQIKAEGLKIKSIHGDFHLKELSVIEDISEIPESDLIIICVKAWQVRNIAIDLKKIIRKNAVLLPLQNGLLITDEIISVFDKEQILAGLCRIISMLEEPGVINHTGLIPEIIFGELNNNVSDRVLRVNEMFINAKISSRIATNIQVELWRKFIETCIGGMFVVTGKTLGELLEMKESRRLLINLLKEIFAVSEAMGVQHEDGSLEEMIDLFQTFPHNTTFSITRDICKGRPSEIEYQNGLVVRLGKELGISTPMNKYIYQSILPLENIARKKMKGEIL